MKMRAFFTIRNVRWTLSLLCSGVALLSIGLVPVRADSEAISFTGTIANGNNAPLGASYSLGWQFSTNTDINVTALGFYNSGLDAENPSFTTFSEGPGVCQCGEVGIYTMGGTLLAQALVTSSDPFSSFFNYATLPTPLLLKSGQTYIIAAQIGSADYTGSDNTGNTIGFQENLDINFIQDEYIDTNLGDGLKFPDASEGITAAEGGGEFGPNFEFTAVATPEPASLELIGLGVGLLAILAVVRR